MPNTIVTRPPFRKRGQPTWIPTRTLNLGSFTGSGGVVVGGGGSPSFTHGPQVPSNIVIEWDLDNDGDFSDSVEDITSYVLTAETTTGRDWPSLLTGKAGPGKFRATLNNDDDRFSYFNTSSPLATAPFSLKTGRKLRVRTTTASNPDPTPLAKDRFGRADGALGTPELGAAWSGPLANDFVIVGMKAEPQTEGAAHIATIDVGATAYYAQARLSEVGGRSNVVGLVYRYQDTTNYSLAVLDVSAAQLKLIDVVAGTPTTIQSEAVEVYDDITIGVLVSGASVTLYHEGVPVLSGTAIQTDETEVGIYASWATNDVRPEVDDFYAWSGLPAEVEGILWTGDVSDLTMSVTPGPFKVATLEGQGWLSRLATQKLTPMRSVEGKRTGILVGNVLGRTNLLHPPGSIDEGDITTGPVGLREMDAIEAARQFEEAEFGFLYESQEGPLTFDSRTARDSRTTTALFSDATADQYHYSEIEPLDWRREVVNRVLAGVAPSAPSGISLTTYTSSGSATQISLTMPATINAGDLLIVNILADPVTTPGTWIIPQGWVQKTGDPSEAISFTDKPLDSLNRILVKIASGDEGGASIKFATMGGGVLDGYAAQLYRVTGWFGSIENGLAISDYITPVGSSVGADDPSVVFPSWGPAPSLFIAWVAAHDFTIGGGAFSNNSYPNGYSNGTVTDDGIRNVLLTARRLGAVEVENPGAFDTTWGVGTTWSEQAIVVAIRGDNSDLNSGVLQVELNDLDSQDDHNSIRTYTDAADLFADTTDATTYAQLVLDRYADDRPLFRITFHATKSGSYRLQASRRRVGDRITLVANGNSGLGVSADYYIESISHRWSKGVTLWETSWELSPV